MYLNHQATKTFTIFILTLVLVIGLACGGGDDSSSQSSAGALPAQPTPDLEKIVEEIVAKMHEDASAEEIQELVRDTVSDAIEVHDNSTDAPVFPNVVVHEDEIVAPQHVPTELDVIWEAWEHLNRDFVEREKLDPELATEFAIRGITSTLGDPQTSYVRKEVLAGQFGDVFEGEFQGIGAFVQMNARGSLVIVSPIEGGPADLAGIRAGDIILEVDGESLEGLSTLEAVSKIRGPQDSIARLLVKKLGEIDPVLVEIKRAVVPLTSVRLRSEPGDKFMHIRLTDFYPQTADKLRDVIDREIQAGAEGLVLDLRSNGGGLLSAAVDVASLFIEDGLALYVVDANNRRTDYNIDTEGREFLTDIPMVVLINEGSASASEILAGALQDHDRAKLIGDTSFGKGSVNWLRRLSNGAGLYITVAHWYTPDGRRIQGEGVAPDIEVTSRDAQKADVDQLNRAIEELESMTGGGSFDLSGGS
ncbi:MAG: S41 family peptidase [Chloroflexi bacterium]|nr:S41 family peptidase [Chloroflexota bacterium]